ncbi:MAG: GrpB family protein, partial [Armatimonadota bacterium]|nr:GrpB family protein [Armatimonadota bacterium]
RLQRLLPTSAAIEHIGSTSVPGLAAKPIIDIMVGLADFTQADALVLRLQSLNYEYVPQFEDEMPFRRYFRKEDSGVRTHQIHMVALSSEFWRRHLFFRDYLVTHPNAAEEYATLKRELAKREWNDVNDYATAKTEFIQRIEAKAS